MSNKNNHLRDTGPIDVSKIQENIKTKEYSAVPYAPETLTITITKEDAGFLDEEARELNLNLQDTTAYVLHRGIELLKELRRFRKSLSNPEMFDEGVKNIDKHLKRAARWKWE